MRDERETRLCRTYIADSIGAVLGGMGSKDVPLFSDLMKPKKKEQSAQEILDHVKGLFS